MVKFKAHLKSFKIDLYFCLTNSSYESENKLESGEWVKSVSFFYILTLEASVCDDTLEETIEHTNIRCVRKDLW